MNKENVVHINNETLLSHKNEWNNATCKTTRRGLEIIILSEVSQRKKNIWYHSLRGIFKKWYKRTYLKNRNRLTKKNILQLSKEKGGSVQISCSAMSGSLQPHESQHTRPPCPSPTPGVYPNSCPSSRWCHPAISSSVVPFSSCPQSLPASGSFQMSQLFAWGGQSIGVSASASLLPMNTQDWSPLGWTGWISLQSKGLSRVFSNTTVQKHQFFGAELSSQSNSHIHTWPVEKTIALTRRTFVGKVMSLL